MICSECLEGTSAEACSACRRMQKEGRWTWEIDNGHRICRCPVCGFGNLIGLYTYNNPYRYCGSCGARMIDGIQMDMLGGVTIAEGDAGGGDAPGGAGPEG